MATAKTHPLSIADLFALTALFAVGLAFCRVTGWTSLHQMALIIYLQFAFHSTVLLRGWPVWHGMIEAIVMSCYWFMMWIFSCLVVSFATFLALKASLAGLIGGLGLCVAFFSSLAIAHKWMRKRHNDYVRRQPEPPVADALRPHSPFSDDLNA